MYLEHFGLKEKPFNITPNPQFIFLSKNHKEVFAHLLYGLQSRCGFIEITGEVGAGKTTVLRTLFEQLKDDAFRLAFIFNPSLSADELLLEICRELDIDTGEARGGRVLPLINRYLLQENAAGRTVVLVIDEAQNLAAPVLEQIRLLSNLETETDKLIQIILVGQPELAEVLGRSNLRQLNQRISVRYHLRPMDEADSRAYVLHRLKVAGCDDRTILTDSALKMICRHSGGLPRLINILADRALLAAFSEDRAPADRADVRTAIAELRQAGSKPPWNPLRRPAATGWLLTAAVVLTTGLFFYVNSLPSGGTAPERAAADSAAVPEVGQTADFEQLEPLRAALAALGESDSFSRAATAVSARWHADFAGGLAGGNFTSRDFASLLERDGWQWMTFQGSLAELLVCDTPVLLELILPGVSGRRYLALTVREGDRFIVAPQIAGRQSLHRSELNALYSGRAYLLWKNYLDIGYVSTPGTTSADIREIQSLLQGAGEGSLVISGVYDDRTIRAVTRFQASRGIARDGRVGPLTLLLLYQQSGYFNPPRLRG